MIKKMSHIGMRHEAAGGENQDAFCYGKNGRYQVISLADGVSSCKEAKTGAEIASRAITELFLKKGNHFLGFENGQIAELALSHVLFELKRQAVEEKERLEAYSSTVASVLYDQKSGKLLYYSLGDSLILAVEKGRCRILAMPSDSSRGCCVTTTKNVSKMIGAKVVDASNLESVVICSDGAWRQMFAINRLKPEAAALLVNHQFGRLKEYLMQQECFDDYSVISMEL